VYEDEGQAEAIILVKASPHVSQKYGETVCCAGVTLAGEWVRLYPVTFRRLDDAKKFKRWDQIRFRWRAPKDDRRPESRRVDQQSIEIIGELAKSERNRLFASLEVKGLNTVESQGKTLALLRPQNPRFVIEPKSAREIEQEKAGYESICKQSDMFFEKSLLPLRPCPFKFKYHYRTDDGLREGSCQDWETDAVFFRWRVEYGEAGALQRMETVFGKEYPQKGMVLAMGTHSRYPKIWLVNAVVRMDDAPQASLF
jgi:hypothetical protein